MRPVWAGSTAHTQAPAPNVVTGQGFPNPNPTVTRNWGQLPAGRKWGTTAGVDISVLKRVPAGAGMGGGSSDAASTLLALNRLWNLNWPRARLQELALPLGASKPSPVSSVDVARAVAAILDDPAPHIGHIYNLTGPESADLDQYARGFSEALGRTIRYRDAPTSEWSETLRAAGLPDHVAHHLTVMTELHKQGRYDRMSEDYLKLTGETPTSMADFVKLNVAEFTRSSRFGAGP